MKSKKGFTLVELMIVVIIMAILVVVAVPIYNSVTDNAREKTCIDNQRQIVSTIGNLYMIYNESGKTDDVLLEFKKTGEEFAIIEKTGSCSAFGRVSLDQIKGSFQTIPVCGDESQIITATITKNTTGGTALVSTECSATDGDGNLMHVMSTLADS